MTGERDLQKLLLGLTPVLRPGIFVFASVSRLPEGVLPVATVAEDEGLTLVVGKAEADRLGVGYGFAAAMITLQVQSALDAVGPSAAVASALAGAGIGCTIVAGCFHDHLFVPFERRYEALAVLKQLARETRAQGAGQAGGSATAGPGPGAVSGTHIREARLADDDALVALWQACGITLPPVNTRMELLPANSSAIRTCSWWPRARAGLPGRSWAPTTGGGAGSGGCASGRNGGARAWLPAWSARWSSALPPRAASRSTC